MDWTTINANRQRSAEKYKFYFGDYEFPEYGKGKIAKSLPVTKIGWGSRAVEMRANKTHFDCFENDTLGFTDIMRRYGVYRAFDMVKEDVLVGGCSFLALAGDKVLPFTSEEATGTFDWQNQILDFGVAVFRDKARKFGVDPTPRSYIIYKKDKTITKHADSEDEVEVLNPTGRPLIGLLTHHSNTKRPFGRSVLTKPARDAIVDASRTIRQAMISAYYYNSKIDVILGADNESSVDVVEAQHGDILKIGPNENGQIPQLGQLAQHAMTPFSDTVMMAARNFCSDTKLSLANLGISSEAPQSPEALEIVGDDLKDDIAEWHAELGQQLKDFCFTIWLYENNVTSVDDNLRAKFEAIVPVWKPIYRADITKFGDGIVKIAQYAPGALKTRSIWRNLGLSSAEIDSVVESIGTTQS